MPGIMATGGWMRERKERDRPEIFYVLPCVTDAFCVGRVTCVRAS